MSLLLTRRGGDRGGCKDYVGAEAENCCKGICDGVRSEINIANIK